jgi:putative ATP-dependent endonuclease of the OLD family
MITRLVIRGYRIFKEFELQPNAEMNILVGDNEAGKSTLLEALSLALTCRLSGRWAQDELNPHWFNTDITKEFFASLGKPDALPPPEITIEVYLSADADGIHDLRGVHNSRRDDVPGISFRVAPAPDYHQELKDYLATPDSPRILPVEWYEVDWRDFSDRQLTKRPRALGVAHIDSRTVRSSAGVDYHTRELLSDFIEPRERAAIAVSHRKARHDISATTLAPVNERIAEHGKSLHDKPIGLQMDQSSNASWETAIVPQVADVPFSMAGQGQQAAIKVVLAMDRAATSTTFALIEEPENHLSHTSLTKLVGRIEDLAGGRQIFLTTHSSFVLNRLGLDKLVLISNGQRASFDDLPSDTVTYFKRLSGYDTMRLVLARKVVLVEGPSDEMVFERAFKAQNGDRTPMQLGVDVISMAGVSLKRGLQLCAALNRQAAAIRDNDGKNPEHWVTPLSALLQEGVRQVFIGEPDAGKTLEPQFVAVNDEPALRKLLDVPSDKDTAEWMEAHKTEWALKLAESDFDANYPQYLVDAVQFVSP